MQTVTTGSGRRIVYERSGKGPAVVIVHGGFVDRLTWRLVEPLLSQHFTVYLLDRPGHGGSDPYPEKPTLSDEAQAVADVINTINQPVYLVGHSSGALVALYAALKTPHVQKLALYEPPLPAPVTPETKQAISAAFAANDTERLAWLGIAGVVGDTTGERPPLEALKQSPIWGALYRNALSVPAEAQIYDSFQFDAEVFRTFTIPTVFFIGTGSIGKAMERSVEALHRALVGSRVVYLEGQGHGAMFSAPSLLAEKLVQFWNG